MKWQELEDEWQEPKRKKRKQKCSIKMHNVMKRDGRKECWHCGRDLTGSLNLNSQITPD